MSDGSDYISIYLNNLDNLNERTSHLCVNILFALRNYKDCSYNKGIIIFYIYFFYLDVIF